MDELILPTLWLLLVAPQLLLSMCVCGARARVGVFHGAFGVRGKYFPHLGRGDEGRLRDGVPFFIAENISSISKKEDKSPQERSRSATGGGLAKFF